MANPLHILFLADGIYPFTIGGMQKHSSELVRGLLHKGCYVKLVFSVGHNENIPAEKEILEKLDIDPAYITYFKWHCIRFPSSGKFPGHYLKESYQFSREIYEYVKNELKEFDLVYAQGFCAWYLLEQKKKGIHIPLTGVHFHGLNMFQKTFGWKASIVARLFRRPVAKNLQMADIVFSYGGRFKEIYKKLKVDQKTFFQPIGIDSHLIAVQPPKINDPLQFVFIGRKDKVKGLDLYHDVITKLNENKYSFQFIGDIALSDQLKRSDCHYYGVIEDQEKNKLLKNADVLVCPSYSEGMPYVILEAMAAGLAVIATDVGAISEMVSKENGIIISPSDTGELQKAIESMERQNLSAMKLKSLEAARNFTWDHIIDEFIERVNGLLKK